MNRIYFSIILALFVTFGMAQEVEPSNQTTRLWVDGVCMMCKNRIEKAAVKVEGVTAASWSVETKILTITVDSLMFNQHTLQKKIAGVGHDTREVKATDEAYNSLHGCCRYRDADVIEAHGGASGSSGSARHEDHEEDHDPGAHPDHQSGAHHDREPVTHHDSKPGMHHAHEPGRHHEHVPAVNPAPETKDRHNHSGAIQHDHSGDSHDESAHHSPIKEGNVTGIIKERQENEKLIPLVGVNVYWMGTQSGTITDEKGVFQLKRTVETDQLIISYIGYGNDTIAIHEENHLSITLSKSREMEEVKVVKRQKTTEVSFINPIQVHRIGEGELQKAACCNLSESFTTNPSIDVTFTDAVTGTRQIQMLGLAGPYVQMTRENMPYIRGLSALYGFTYTPGHWIESIQLNKGTGSVVNGYESMSGQINVELRKPEDSEKAYFNLYSNEGGRLEANANISHRFSDRLSTALLLHSKYQNVERDRNNDSFLDKPLGENVIGLNRWRFTGNNGLRGQFGYKFIFIDNASGQLQRQPSPVNGSPGYWKSSMRTRRAEVWAKTGWVNPDKPTQSLGLQLSSYYHLQDAFFGLREYDADQTSLYANLLFQDIISNPNHTFKTGMSFQYDLIDEMVNQQPFDRNEIVPGAFFEYNLSVGPDFNAVAGLRGDYHNHYGLFATPRLHLRYALNEATVLRGAAGKGLRTASILAENVGIFASARDIVINQGNNQGFYLGLQPEISWNYGINLTRGELLFDRELQLSLDYYYTGFDNQIVVDYDYSPTEVHFYNLSGQSYSHSTQAQVDYEVFENFDIRLAYRYNDVKTTYSGRLMNKPLHSRHRSFINLAYETLNNWGFDFTLNWQGEKRIPSTASNPPDYRVDEQSPSFFLANAQVSKLWKNGLEIYLGGENLFNYVQPNPIISSNNPFGDYFDSSMIWGPVFGRNLYLGLRYKL